MNRMWQPRAASGDAGVERSIGRRPIVSPATVRSTRRAERGVRDDADPERLRRVGRRRPLDELGEIEEERRLDVVLGGRGPLFRGARRAGGAANTLSQIAAIAIQRTPEQEPQ